jgi:hypothetical protein
MRPIPKEMVEWHLYQLRESPGGDRSPVAREQLWAMWAATPWGVLWAFVLIIAACGIVAGVVEGWTLGASIVFGLLIGPGWLAFATCAGLIYWAFGGRSDHSP